MPDTICPNGHKNPAVVCSICAKQAFLSRYARIMNLHGMGQITNEKLSWIFCGMMIVAEETSILDKSELIHMAENVIDAQQKHVIDNIMNDKPVGKHTKKVP
jgi:hypothetical protein